MATFPSRLNPIRMKAKAKLCLTVAGDRSHNKTVVLEHCKQCNSFKTRAFQVRGVLEKGVPGIKVLLNLEKPRRGCYGIREKDLDLKCLD